jgi:hypothetical protein
LRILSSLRCITATIQYFSGFCQEANVTLTSKDLECATLPSQTSTGKKQLHQRWRQAVQLTKFSAIPSGSKTPQILGPSADLSTKAKIGIIAGSSGAGVLLILLLCLLTWVLLQAKKMKSEINQLRIGHGDTSTRNASLPPPQEMAMPTPELESAKLEGNYQVQEQYSPGTEICLPHPQDHNPRTQTYLQTGWPRPVHELQTWSGSPVQRNCNEEF